MPHTAKFRVIPIFMAALMAVFGLLFYIKETKEKAWGTLTSNLMKKNAELMNENEHLKQKISDLKKRNLSLERYLHAYEDNLLAIKDAPGDYCRTETELVEDLPGGLAAEPFEIRQIYREMLSEKKRWDDFQQAHYKNILESTVEPQVFKVQSVRLENEGNRQHLLELENALMLHKRLIRDVRLFHDEIQYQKKQLHAQQSYQLYDLKFKLAPFARESALVDALQQAMSALSSGIYQMEAQEVLDRIGEEFTKPIRQLSDQRQNDTESLVPTKYNYNFYSVYGKKLLDYSDTLAEQSSIMLGPAAFGELDFFNRRMYESLYDLYHVGQGETIDPSHLDLDELEQVLYSRN